MQNRSLYGIASSKEIDRLLIASGKTGFFLMMKAANAVLETIGKYHVRSIVVLAGSGNNGGDGFGLSGLASLRGYNVQVIATEKTSKSVDSERARLFAKSLGVQCKVFEEDVFSLPLADCYIDALIGLGIRDKFENSVGRLITLLNQRIEKSVVISLDVPSGLNSDNGIASNPAVIANETVTFLTDKPGLHTGDGPAFGGEITYTGLGEVDEISMKPDAEKITRSSLFLKKHPKTVHKISRGSVLVIGGTSGMEGAGILTSIAAFRAGAGKVFLTNDTVKTCASFSYPEIVKIPLDYNMIMAILQTVNVVIAGPGLPVHEKRILSAVWTSDTYLVIDAGALRWLAKSPIKKRKTKFIGTPHYGEAADLVASDDKNRFKLLKKLESQYGGSWILKGPGTLVSGSPIKINCFANGSLATAGSGDVLAGIVGGIWSQGIPNPEALSVYIHTESAKVALNKIGGRGIIASDILNEIGHVVSCLEDSNL